MSLTSLQAICSLLLLRTWCHQLAIDKDIEKHKKTIISVETYVWFALVSIAIRDTSKGCLLI